MVLMFFILVDKIPLFLNISNRFFSIKDFFYESSYQIRIIEWNQVLLDFKKSFIFGYGPGSIQYFEKINRIYFSDIGLPNTLIQYGVLGLISIISLNISVFHYALKRVFRLNATGKGILVGAMSCWLMFICAYCFSIDFFTLFPWTNATMILLVIIAKVSNYYGLEINQEGKSL
jgi:O-antigen ligase